MPESTVLDIALLTHSVNPRGGVVHTLALGEALFDAGHRVTVFAPAVPGQVMFREARCKVELVRAESVAHGDTAQMVEGRIAAYVAHFEAVLASRRFDIFHAQDSISGNALAELRALGRIDSFVRTVHHLDHFDDARLAHWQHRAFAEASQVLVVSETWQRTMVGEYGINAALVRNGVDMQRYNAVPGVRDAQFVERLGLHPGGPVFLAIGGVEERKNTQRIFEAFVQLRASLPDAQLVISGGASLLDHDAYQRDFAARVEASGIASGPGQALVLTGTVPDDKMPPLIRSADVVLMPSLREGFGLVVLEGLATGKPVVVSRIAPFTEYLHGAPVHWADPLDAASIAMAMHDASRAPTFAPPSVCYAYSWSASAARHEALYRLHAKPSVASFHRAADALC